MAETIKEAFAVKAKNLLLSGEEINLYLKEIGLDGNAEYDYSLHGKDVELKYSELLLFAIYVSEKREDDVSVKYTIDTKAIYSAIMRKWGLIDPFAAGRPTVKRLYV